MSDSRIIFNSILPAWIILTVGAVLLAFFLYQEWRRKQRFLVLRIVAQVIIIASLLAIVLRPSVKTEKATGSALLLTAGYDKKTADSLIAKYHLRTLRSSDALPYPKSTLISNWHDLKKDVSDIRFVTGSGIPSFALEENDNLNFDFIPSTSTDGIFSLENRSHKANKENIISGQYYSSKDDAIIKLIGPGGKEDSTEIKGKGLHEFRLRMKNRQAGKFVYQITSQANDQTKTENLPIQVEAENQLKILFIQQFPTFETKYLKNYLSEKGHAITLRYQISKNTYRYEYANQRQQLVPRLTSDLLQSLDLIVLTASSFQDLSAAEIQTLDQSIQSGLGLLILFDQKVIKNVQRVFPFELQPAKTDTVNISSAGWSEKITIPALPIRPVVNASVQSIFTDSDKKILSGYYYQGFGKAGFQILNETYRLSLEGKANEYADIWAPLIENIARAKTEKYKIKITTAFPRYPNEPVNFDIIATNEAPQLYYDSVRLPLTEDVTISQLWHGTVWADQPGWHQFTLQDSSQFDFYVSDHTEWKELRKANQITENKTYQSLEEAKSGSIVEYQPLSPLLFFVLFLLASGALWLMAKL